MLVNFSALCPYHSIIKPKSICQLIFYFNKKKTNQMLLIGVYSFNNFHTLALSNIIQYYWKISNSIQIAHYHLYSKLMITSCQMLGFQGILLQLSVGLLSFFALVLKRWLEFPKRPWKIWILDSSKQAISLIIIHCINLTISLVLSNNLSNDACLWYFITNLMDNTLGVLIIYLLLKFIQKFIFEGRCPSLISGNYYEIFEEGFSSYPDFSIQSGEEQKIPGKIPSASLTIEVKVSILAWFVQFLIWMMIASLCKVIIFVIQLRFNKLLNDLSMFLFRWVQPYPILQLSIIIIVIPITLNGIALWIQDNFLKKSTQQFDQEQLNQIQIPE